MNEAIQSYKLSKGRVLEVFYDEDSRDIYEQMDFATTICTWHDRCKIGNVQLDRHASVGYQLAKEVRYAILKDNERSYSNTQMKVKAVREANALQDGMERISEKNIDDRQADAEYLELCEKYAYILPVYLYEHSGMTIKTSPFSCPWDSGQVGFAFITLAQVRALYTGGKYLKGESGEYSWRAGSGIITKKRIEQVHKLILNEIEIVDTALRGDIVGYVIKDKDGDEKDSCWGFYGSDIRKNGILGQLNKADAKAIRRQA